MKMTFSFRKRLRKERGQTLILGFMAIVILIVGVLVLFDVQRIIRGKIKVMSAIDSAALTGAKWQQNTLNLVGELNLIKACNVLITDPLYGLGKNTDTFTKTDPKDPASIDAARREMEQLKDTAELLTQMQVRASFVGPLIGFGAAQQAAKNNGLTYNENCNWFLRQMYRDVTSDDYYGNPDIVPKLYYNYAWRDPYAAMLSEILGGVGDTSKGVAVGTNVDYLGMPKLYSDPPTKPNFIAYLQSRVVMEAIEADDWCILRALLAADYPDKWWGNIKISENKKFVEGSEIIPIHTTYFVGEQIYDMADTNGMLDEVIRRKPGRDQELKKLGSFFDRRDPVDTQNSIVPGDTDQKFNPLPEIPWATFDSHWRSYDDYGISKSDWEGYLRAPFRKGADYYSGALSYFSIQVPDTSVLSNYDFGKSLRFGGERNSAGRTINSYARKTENAFNRFDDRTFHITFDATAKPVGSLKTESGEVRYPFAAGMVLPVFDKVTLIPVSLEPVEGMGMDDRDWIIYITKYLPALGTVDHLDDVAAAMDPEDFARTSKYHRLIKKLGDPLWRARGLDWLEAEATGRDITDSFGNVIGHETLTRNKDHCDDWGKGQGGGNRYGPGKLH